MADRQCVFSTFSLLLESSTSNLANRSVIGSLSGFESISCENTRGSKYLCTGEVPQETPLSSTGLEILLNPGDQIDILEFQQGLACFEDSEAVVTTKDFETRCRRCGSDKTNCKIEITSTSADSVAVDLIEVLGSFQDCSRLPKPISNVTNQPENVPTQSNESSSEFADSTVLLLLSSFIGLVTGMILCVCCLIITASRRSRQNSVTTSLGFNQVESEGLPLFARRPRSFLKESSDTSLNSSGVLMARIRLSGLSLVTTKTCKSFKTDITPVDTQSQTRVKSLLSGPKRQRYSFISQLVSHQMSILSSSVVSTEDNTQKVLDKVVPYLEDKINRSKFRHFQLSEHQIMPLRQYLERLMKGLNAWYYEDEPSPEVGVRCLFLALLYFDKMNKYVKNFKGTTVNFYKVVAIFMLIAAKFTEDEIISNSYWAEVCGFPLDEVSRIERLLCFSYGFDFDVKPKQLQAIFRMFNTEQYPDTNVDFL